MEIRKNGVTHQIALCEECGMEWQIHRGQKARKQAYAHAKSTGHRVSLETATSIVYNP